MLQSRCISEHKLDFEFSSRLHAAGFGKEDLVVSGLRIHYSNGLVTCQMKICMLVCFPAFGRKNKELVSSDEMMVVLT